MELRLVLLLTYFAVAFASNLNVLNLTQVVAEDETKEYLFDTDEIDRIRLHFCDINRTNLLQTSTLVYASGTRHRKHVRIGIRRKLPSEIQKEIPSIEFYINWYRARGYRLNKNYGKEIQALEGQLQLINDALDYIEENGFFEKVKIRRLKNCNEYYYEHTQEFKKKKNPPKNHRKTEINWKDKTPVKTNYKKGTHLDKLDTWYQVCFDEAEKFCEFVGYNLYYVQ